ncbi:hypothetical protein Cgig2_017705 [Carnegiea gigantea]|uniref:RNase H type-1 domain-containing protein n=1 Tax=Carnegiea gigantea TaxID=171969 RepID=A0A9Q1K3E0_9CARY|nr:hypothetical protein Cgig2_017705 [Carnegiea gigantea]
MVMEIKRRRHLMWICTIVYANPHFASYCSHIWLISGDFNETINLEERNNGGSDMLQRCNCFKHWIENNGFMDLGFLGRKYTWIRGRNWDTMKCAHLKGNRIEGLRALTGEWCHDQERVKSIVVNHFRALSADNREEEQGIHDLPDLITGSEWMVRVTHCFREANQVTDRLANLGVMTSLGVTVLQNPPLEVRDVLLADCMRAAWRRVCKRWT